MLEQAALGIVRARARQQDKITNLGLALSGIISGIGPIGAKEIADYIHFTASVFGGVWRGRQGNCACPVLGHSGELAELGLGNSQIGGEGAKAIADVLKSGTAVLTTLVLNENNIGDKVAKAIADALQSGMAMLHMLSLIT